MSFETQVIAATRAWVDRAVIGLNLCPFAQAVQLRQQVRYVETRAADVDSLAVTLREELEGLAASDPAERETTLLIHPWVLGDFLDFNDFLEVAEGLPHELELDGILQIASFHPRFRFAGTTADDVSNATNQSPYPTLHLLRESSVERAVAALDDPAAIYEQNIETLRALGPAGWKALQAQWLSDAREADTSGLYRPWV
jgi:uncharacterized protein